MMKAPLLLAILALALSVLGLVGPFLDGAGGKAPAGGTLATGSTYAELDARIAAWVEEVEGIKARLEALEMRPGPGPAQRMPVLDGFVRKEDLADLIRDLERTPDSTPDSAAAKAAGKEVLSEGLQDQVVEALAAIRRDEELERAFASQGKNSGTVEQRVTGWSKWLDLDDGQQAQLSEIIELRDSQEGELLSAWKNGADPAEIEEALGHQRNEFQRSIRTVLRPEQAARFNGKFGDGSGN